MRTHTLLLYVSLEQLMCHAHSLLASCHMMSHMTESGRGLDRQSLMEDTCRQLLTSLSHQTALYCSRLFNVSLSLYSHSLPHTLKPISLRTLTEGDWLRLKKKTLPLLTQYRSHATMYVTVWIMWCVCSGDWYWGGGYWRQG